MTVTLFSKTKWTYLLAAFVGLVVIGSVMHTGNVFAADARNFNAGRIIDDSIFTNYNSMSVQDIQNFLNSKVTCDSYGKKTSELGGGTRAQWMSANGNSAPYRCVTDYAENVATGQNNYGKTTNPAGSISAAQIIYNYSQQFKINPQVIIVTLQKENGLITDEWPTPRQFTQAMGFGCPDNLAPGAPACDPTYGSFSAQVYQAARHFRGFFDNQAGWYIPFNTGNNQIMWNVASTNCGSGTVNIENRATVALYSYTPYQPNQAAKNAQYGRGDGCSAYGNRNFYLYFTDWFGPTLINSNFLRTVDNGTLYLLAKGVKYPVPNMDVYNALYPLGGVGYVSQSLLDSLTTGPTLGRVIRSSTGTVYFYDAGIKLPFGSCTLVANYGSTCGQSILLEDYQINQLYSGPGMTNLYQTNLGKTFYVDGTKREVYDAQSLKQAGINGAANSLTESAIDNLSYGAPIIRDDVIVKDRDTGQMYLSQSGALSKITFDISDTSLVQLTSLSLDDSSVVKVTKAADITAPLFKSSTGQLYVLTRAGKVQVTNAQDWGGEFSMISDGTLSQITTVSTLQPPYIVKSEDSGTVYVLDKSTKRAFLGWNDLVTVSNTQNPNITVLPKSVVEGIPNGINILSPGSLVKSANNTSVYMINGLNNKVLLNSFDPAQELGINGFSIAQDSDIAGYTTSPSSLSAAVICGGVKKIAIGGALYDATIDTVSYVTLDAINCTKLQQKGTSPLYMLAPDGTIYKLENGLKRPIGGYQTYLSLGGNQSNTIKISNYILSYLKDGQRL